MSPRARIATPGARARTSSCSAPCSASIRPPPASAASVVRPALGKLTNVAGTVPHPKGEIKVGYALSGGKLEATVTLPAGVEGEFVWKGQRRPLPAGTSKLVF